MGWDGGGHDSNTPLLKKSRKLSWMRLSSTRLSKKKREHCETKRIKNTFAQNIFIRYTHTHKHTHRVSETVTEQFTSIFLQQRMKLILLVTSGAEKRALSFTCTSHLPSGQYFLRLKLGNWDDIFKCPENPNCTDACFIEEKFRAHRGFTEKYFNKYFLITYTVVGIWCLRDMDVVKTDKTHWLHGSYIR